MDICGARTKGTGDPCRRLPCKNGRCKLHGGHSTGPRTPEGLERCKMASWKHGRRSKEAVEESRLIKELIKKCDDQLESLR